MKKPGLLKTLLLLVLSSLGFYLLLKQRRTIARYCGSEQAEPENDIDPKLPQVKAGDILLFNHAKNANRLITNFTDSPFYHVGIGLDGGRVIEARPRGVVIRDLAGNDGDRRFEIIPRESIAREEEARRAIAWAKEQLGDGYDPANALSIVLNRCFEAFSYKASLPDRWTCGDFVATAFQHAGGELFPGRSAANLVPADYARFLPENRDAPTQVN